MYKKLRNQLSFEDFMSNLRILDNGCWIYPTSTVYVKHKGKQTYIIPLIFRHFGKQYNGKIKRICGNKRCFNPNHLVSKTNDDRFWEKVDVHSEDECWEWLARCNQQGYGYFSIRSKNYGAHRYSWESYNQKKIPDGMYVCHHCDNPSCVNPNHLFLGTHQDNVDDRELKERNKLPGSKGEDHGLSKLTEDDVLNIRKLYSSGVYSYRKLAKKYGVSFGNIRKIIKRATWDWLKG